MLIVLCVGTTNWRIFPIWGLVRRIEVFEAVMHFVGMAYHADTLTRTPVRRQR